MRTSQDKVEDQEFIPSFQAFEGPIDAASYLLA